MIETRTRLAAAKRIAAVLTGTMIALSGFLGTAQFAHAAGLTSTNVQPASLVAGATSVVTATFTTATELPGDGKIKVTFPSGFNVAGASGGTCSTMDGVFTTTVADQVVTIARGGPGNNPEATGPQTCTINGIVNPNVAGSTGTYTIQTTDVSNVEVDVDAAVAADTIVAAALTSTNVQPSTLTAGASTTVTITFTSVNTLEANGKIKVTFPSGFNVASAASGACSTMDGSFATSVDTQTVILTRSTGGVALAGAHSCTVSGISNPGIMGSTGTYTITTTTSADAVHDTDAAVAADTISPGALGSTNVQPATLIAGASGMATATFTMLNTLELDGKIEVTFPSGYGVTGATGGTCSGMDGSFTTTVADQVVTLTRSGGSTATIGAKTCTINAIVNPVTAGSTGTYMIKTRNSSGVVHDSDSAVTADTIVAATLTSTNVEPSNLRSATSSTATVYFTMVNALESTGKIVVTFPSGFNVTGATGGTCSTMNGSFTTAVAGQVVTLTRSGGDAEAAGAQICTISMIVNPGTAGSTGTYTITTTTSADAVHDTDAAVTADTITRTSSASEYSSTPLTYGIMMTLPVAADVFMPGDEIAIAWNTSSGTGTPSYVNLAYSTDGGVTSNSIIENTVNDGAYTWTAPSISAQSVTILAEGTDLVTVLATDSSDAFSIGTEESISDETSTDSGDATTLLAEGTFMRGESWSTVYFIGADGARRPFLDSQTFFTYADDFSSVVNVTDESLTNYPIGAPMMAKAGSVLIKVQSVNNVYALEEGNILRWITSEALATELYGSNWADYVIDVPATAWGQFTIGDDIQSASEIDVDTSGMSTRSELNA
ncbi:MAG: hypothetical protein WCT28_02625 [Patescibacteria group bacterium]